MRAAAFVLGLSACRASVPAPPAAQPPVALPPLAVMEAPAEDVASLPEPLVRSLDALAPRIAACGASVAEGSDPSRVRVVFDLVIGARGEAVTVHATRSSLPLEVTFCMERVLRQGPYPRPDSPPVRLSIPVRLGPR